MTFNEEVEVKTVEEIPEVTEIDEVLIYTFIEITTDNAMYIYCVKFL